MEFLEPLDPTLNETCQSFPGDYIFNGNKKSCSMNCFKVLWYIAICGHSHRLQHINQNIEKNML
jgi:hypothetical protein